MDDQAGGFSAYYPGLLARVERIGYEPDRELSPQIRVTQHPLPEDDATPLAGSEPHELLAVLDAEHLCSDHDLSSWVRGSADAVVDRVAQTPPLLRIDAILRWYACQTAAVITDDRTCLVARPGPWTPEGGRIVRLVTMSSIDGPPGPVGLYGPALHEWTLRRFMGQYEGRRSRGEPNVPGDDYIPDWLDILDGDRLHQVHLGVEDITWPSPI